MRDSDRRIIQSIFKMNTPTWLTLAIAVFTFVTPAQTSEPRVVCYYTNWSVYRPGTARFNPQNINPYLCTHLIYAFGGFTKENTLKPFDKYQDIEKGGYAKFTGLKTYNKNLKTLLAIGGWNEGSARFSPMVASKERRKEFVRNAIKFLRQNRFDGLDLDWEYPAFRDGGKPKDRENYAKLVRELREEFDREAEKTGRPRLLLTMAVPAGIEYIQKGFDVKTLNQYLDWMNLLTYDYHSAFEPAVNHHAPLYPLEEPSEYSVDSELNIDYTIKFYLENGADRDKLVLGIPTYGRSYTLFNPDAVDIGSPADGPGEQGDATREKGYLAYYEICEALKPKQKKRSSSDEDSEEEDEEDQPWTVTQPNPNAMGPVAYRGNQWVGYDDIDIVKKKAEYVAESGLGGIMFWSIDNDDFRGNCHGKPYPLIEAAKEAYIVALGSTDNAIVTDKPRSITTSRASSRRRNKPKSSTTTTVRPSTNNRKSALSTTTPSWNNTPEPPTTPDPGSDFKCTDEGFFPHPRDCKKYFWCLDSGPSNLGIVAHQFTCPSGLFFNKAADSCDFARNVLCKKPAATTKAPATQTTTTKPTTTSTSTSTTTRRSVKLSTKSAAQFRTKTTTTTPEPESDEEYEDEIAEDEAQDPKVIKELIDLIKKVGGVEQLEKHLHLAESSMSTDGAITTTPSSFNKKLYQKVLEKARANRLNTLSKAKEESAGAIQNSRRGPQNAGLESTSDKDKLLRKDRPQYTTIQRNRPATAVDPLDEEDPEVPDVPQQLARSRVVETEVKVGTTAKPLQYVNIRRVRPTSDSADDTASRNALFERPESFVAVSEPSLDISVARRENMPEYVTIRRQRPTTVEATTVQYDSEDKEEESHETALEREISSPPSQPQYTSIVRTRSTTLNPPEEKNSPESPEPTTILAVQIASLLNSPSASEEPEAPETTIAEATTADATTTSTSRPTTTTTTTPTPSTRRAVQRRRGSTTSTTPASSTTQAGKRPNFLRRTKSTSPPETATETTVSTSETNTKYTRRHNFKSRKEAEQDTKETAAKETAKKEAEFERRRPSLNSGGARSERPTRNFVRKRLGGANSTTSTSTTPSSLTTKRPFRIASRRRPFVSSTTKSPTKITSTTAKSTSDPSKSTGGLVKSTSGPSKSTGGLVKSTSGPVKSTGGLVKSTSGPVKSTIGLSTTRGTTVSGISSTVIGTRVSTEETTAGLSEEFLQDVIDDADSIEDPNFQERTIKKINKNQRRPLILKEEDQNPSATNEDKRKRSKISSSGSEEDKNRKSKKYSSSFKQNQLDEVLRQKALSQEVDDAEETTEGKVTTYEEYSAETALAIATHQLLSAPLPSIAHSDEDDKPKKSTQATKSYKNTNHDFTEGYTNTDTKAYDYSSTPIYKSTVSYASTKLSTPKTSISSYVPTPPKQFSTTFYDTPNTSTYVPKSSLTSTLTSKSPRPFSTPTVLSSLGASLGPEITSRGSTEFRGQSTLKSDYVRPTIDTDFPRGRTTYSGFASSLRPTSSPGFSSSLSPVSLPLGVSHGLSPSTARYLPSEKLIPVPVEDYAYSTVGHASLGQEPAYFTREYLLESPVTKTYDDEYQYLSPVTTEPTTRKIPKKTIYKRISTTIPPTVAPHAPTTAKPRRLTTKKPFEKVPVEKLPSKKYKPVENYDYYDDGAVQMADTYEEGTKVILHAKGTIQCLDIGNFPHPTSCKKFISCARLENGSLLGWAYICPKGLSFDPVGGMCNWSAGLGCDEKDV